MPTGAVAAPLDAQQKANERWQAEQQAARAAAIADAEENSQIAQQKADKIKQDIDKKQKEAAKQQAIANEQSQKAKNLQGGAALPQSDQPDMTEAEFKRAFIHEREKSIDRVQESEGVIKSFTTGKMHISAGLLRQAKCVVILPSTKKAAFVFGADYARGLMSCRLGDNFDGPWSPPNMIALEGASFGPQIGVQGTDWVFLIMNERGVNSVLSSKGKLGADFSVAAGPWGRSGQAATDLAMRAEILSFSHAHGIFLGADILGSSLRPDRDANYALYGRNYNPKDIVRSGEIRVPPEAVPLTNMLQEASNRPEQPPKQKEGAKPPGGRQ
jgi:lipid-binding SYLF domain-containing protein